MKQAEQLRTFIAVAELGSFTAAAVSLGLPKANVSVAMQALESELGVQLFHRTTRSVRLTSDGHGALDKAKELLNGLDEWTQLFQREPSCVKGRLRVDTPVTIARDVVIPKLPTFLERYPNLTIELGSTDRFVDVVQEGYDCVVRVGTLVDSSLVARAVGKYRVINCVSRSYAQQYGKPKTLADLSRHRLVHYSNNLGASRTGFEYEDPKSGQERSVIMSGALTVNSATAYTAAALAGLGLVQVPEVGVRDHLQTGELIEVLSEFTPLPLPVTLLYPAKRNLPTRVRVFMDWLTELLLPRMMLTKDSR
jgi:DNA-binding transcriptional LysR family regulator